MAGTKHIETYKDAAGKYRYRVVAANHKIVDVSEQGFTRRNDAKRRAVKDHPGLPVEPK